MTALVVVLGLLSVGVVLYAAFTRWSERQRRGVALGAIGLAAISVVVLVIEAATASCDADDAVSIPLLLGTWALLTFGGVLALRGSWVRSYAILNPLVLGIAFLGLCAASALLIYVVVDFAVKLNCSPY